MRMATSGVLRFKIEELKNNWAKLEEVWTVVLYFVGEEVELAMACPAIQPVVQADWKLKPPVRPSISSDSPAK